MAANSNPAFSNSPAFSDRRAVASRLQTSSVATPSAEQLDDLYGRPSATPAETDRMTYEDTIVKTVISFAVLVAGAAIGWFAWPLAIPAAIVGFALALVNTFKKRPSAALVLAYAAVEGVFVGAISGVFATQWDGIVPQAVFGTLGVVGVTLALFASGRIRASARATKIFLVALVGYGVFSLINLGLMVFGTTDSMFGLRGDVTIFGIPLGLVLAPLIVILAAYSLVLDFDSVQTGVRRGAPRVYGWQAAFGIMVTVVWLYLEILRILGLARSN
ncbi:Bax inhibitor-1/YccA family protein [Galbitalea sp. SE-J8]|uniref:Bax inhibitor-1/YccA family protein n=1 Tax=Galbitalea sp. SE-J8 TaxID=3054952 RepID=UPI00259CDDC9|nr:Bax inhibitor-1/YccA family protein [Galbitalea sp. SE-J8]MDM4761426.1 Bax inhibitor-1/YccA family protein [Galbitalea sp. SE-J8]